MSSDDYLPPPSLSSTVITNHSETQFGQRTVADESYTQPTSRSALHPVGNSFTGGYSDRFQTQIDQAPGLEDVVHQNNSTPGFNEASVYAQPPSQSAMVPINLSNPGGSGSAANPAYGQQANAGMSINGRNFKKANLMTGFYK